MALTIVTQDQFTRLFSRVSLTKPTVIHHAYTLQRHLQVGQQAAAARQVLRGQPVGAREVEAPQRGRRQRRARQAARAPPQGRRHLVVWPLPVARRRDCFKV